MFRHVAIAAAIWFASGLQLGDSYRILGVFPTPSISHQVVFRALTLALNKHGHELVVITTDPINDPTLKNYTEIDISFLYDLGMRNLNYVENRGKNVFMLFIQNQSPMLHNMLDGLLACSEVRRLYGPQSNEQFDLMLVETLYWPGVMPFAERFDVPFIGITSLGLTLNNQYAIGNPIMPSHHTNWELEYKVCDQLSFWQRLENFYISWRHIHWYRNTYVVQQKAIAAKYFGNDISDPSDIEKNVSLIFVNQREPISYARPNSPNVINIGGFHVSKTTNALPKDLKEFLDEATAGFVYMSLGTNAKSIMLPDEAIHEFVTAFSRLPYKVLWKFEDEILPGKPDNVHIMKWVPQQAVLAHPNLKVFIYQGGLQSTEEAVAHAIPLVGFPILADQEMQVMKMASLGVAVKLETTAVDGNELYEAITTVAGDSSYKQRMLNLRSLIEDKPHDPLENAVWWTEYVIRHRGAPHLHSSTADEPWYTRQDMDIVAFISAVSAIVLIMVLVTAWRVVRRICTVRVYNVKSKIN